MKRHARLIVADSENNADLLWATRFFVPDPCIFIEKMGKKYLVLSDLEYTRAQKEAAVHYVLSYQEILGSRNGKGESKKTLADYLDAALKKLQIRTVEVPADFSLKIAETLRHRGYRVHVGSDPFFPERAIKTAEEVRAITRSIRSTERAVQAALAVLKRARLRRNRLIYKNRVLTSEFLKQVINISLMEERCVAKHTIVACGRQTADPHCEGFGPLQPHQPIVIDVFPRSEKTGYHADITRTVCRGRAPDTLHAMYRAVRMAEEGAIQKIRHRVEASTIHRLATNILEQQGFKTERQNGILQGFIHSTGHGLGLDVHEYPRMGEFKNRLQAGHVVTVEPGLYYKEVGGIRIEDDVLVTKRGHKVLSRLSKHLEIL